MLVNTEVKFGKW